MKSFNCEEKNIVRTNNFINPIAGKKFKVVLSMTSKECLCLKELMKNKNLYKNVFVIVVEFEEENIPAIKRFLKKHFPNRHHLYYGDMCFFDPTKILNGRKIDLAYFDFCGNFKMERRAWFFKNNHHFADGCRVCHTYKTITRKKQAETATKRYYVKKVMSIIENKTKFIPVCGTLIGLWGRKQWEKDRTNVLVSVNCILADLYVSFNERDFDIKQVILYKDSTEMVFIDTILNGSKKSTKPLFERASSYYINKVCKAAGDRVKRVLGTNERKKRRKNRAVKKQTFAEICGVKNRKDLLTAGRKAVVTKRIKQYAKENKLTETEASKRVRGGIGRELTSRERKVA